MLAGTASALYGAWPSVASNVVWAAIGIQSTAVAVRRRVRSRRSRATTPLEALYEPLADCLV